MSLTKDLDLFEVNVNRHAIYDLVLKVIWLASDRSV